MNSNNRSTSLEPRLTKEEQEPESFNNKTVGSIKSSTSQQIEYKLEDLPLKPAIKYQLGRQSQIFTSGLDQYEFVNQLKKYDPETTTSITLKDLQIKELTQFMKQRLQRFKKLDTLNITRAGLKSLDNLPNLPMLETLRLPNNLIGDFQIKKLINCYPNLLELNLKNNKIKNQKHVEQFEESNIEELDLRGNTVSEKQFTHEFIFDKVKSLMVFNGKYKDGESVKEVAFDDELDDCLSQQSSVDFNNPDSDDQQDEKAKNASANYWYQPKSKRNLRYLKNVTPLQKLKMKKRRSPYEWNREQSNYRKMLKLQKLQNLD